LALSNCGLSSESARIIADSLRENENGVKLASLFIGRNRLENEGAAAFAEYFATYDSLELVHMYGNGVRGEGLIPLFQALVNHASAGSLIDIDINDNFVESDEAIKALSELVISATNL